MTHIAHIQEISPTLDYKNGAGVKKTRKCSRHIDLLCDLFKALHRATCIMNDGGYKILAKLLRSLTHCKIQYLNIHFRHEAFMRSIFIQVRLHFTYF